MESPHEDPEHDTVAKAVRAASIAQSTRKKAEKAAKEALEVARREMKRKGKEIETRKIEVRKRTMRSYFLLTRGAGGGQPLAMALNGSMPDVLGVESNFEPEYPSDGDRQQLGTQSKSTSVSFHTTVTPGSSSRSDTVVLSAKSPLITISKESDELDNSKLVEIHDDSGESDSDSDFQSPPHKRSVTSTKKRFKDQKRYDRHCKFQTIWAAKLPWAEGVMNNNDIWHLVKCKLCSTFKRKPYIMAPKSDTLFK